MTIRATSFMELKLSRTKLVEFTKSVNPDEVAHPLSESTLFVLYLMKHFFFQTCNSLKRPLVFLAHGTFGCNQILDRAKGQDLKEFLLSTSE